MGDPPSGRSERLRVRLRDAGARELRPEELSADALVLAPHPDDEVLGCGGTIVTKRRAGARVMIAWMTDGRRSHDRLMDADELGRLRRCEALCAAERLGVPAEDTAFLDFENERVAEHQSAAAGAVGELVAKLEPAQVLLPCPWDIWPDHLATTAAGRALRERGFEGSLLGYPIWFWNRWPWTPPPDGSVAHNALRALAAHWRLWRAFGVSVDVEQARDAKRAALACHRTQVERLVDDPRWAVLAEVAGGHWLPLLLDRREAFVELP